MACPTLASGAAFLSTLLNHIDCQAQTIGTNGYQAMASPTSPMSLVLTGLLIIFVALFGLRMVLGNAPTLQSSVMAVVRIGVVLVIATSWPAYRTLVYDVVIHGPTQLATLIGGSAQLPGSNGDLIARVQWADIGLIRLTNLGTGREPLASLPSTGSNGLSGPAQRFPIEDDPAFGGARVAFMVSVISALAVVRLTAGILLALAPLLAGLLLFDMARGLVVGWARAMVFTLLASVSATVIIGVELALLEPWLAQVLQLRQAGAITASAPVELLVVCLAFALALFGCLAILLRLAFMVQLPAYRSARTLAVPVQPAAPQAAPAAFEPQITDQCPPRAVAIADALNTAQRREHRQPLQPAGATGVAPGHPMMRTTAGVRPADTFTAATTSQALRRTKPRPSLSAALRDRRP